MPAPDRRVADAVDRLVAAGCVAAQDEAAAFVAAAPDDGTLDAWLRRRERGEPPAWITGTFVFCGRPLRIEPGVYVPRHQSEGLARRAAAKLVSGGRAVDLCTGAGAIAAHLRSEVPTAMVIGVDLDERAAACARRNGVPVVLGDLASPLRRPDGRDGRDGFEGFGGLDLVTAVAPYVPTGELRLLPADVQRYEPRLALDGGDDGLDLVRRVVVAAGHLLRPGGWLLTEVGGEQDEALAPTLTGAGFGEIEPWWDDDGDLRGLAARRDPRG